jgi:16S rRNA processing protein RimM
MEEYLEIGQIVNTNGLKGFLKVKPLTDDITRFEELETVYIQKAKELIEFKIQEVKYVKNMVLLKLEGIDDITEAEKYKNFYIKINRKDAVELDEDSYFIIDIIGCEVFTEENQKLGKVVDVFPTGSNDVYTVKNEEGKEILLPAIADVIKDVDVKNKKIVIHLMEGLI